jgi:hypothetical protein
MATVHAKRLWPVLNHGLLGQTLALGIPTLTVYGLTMWDVAIGPHWAWTISTVVFGGLGAVATVSFAIGVERAPLVAVSDQRKLAAIGPIVFLASLMIVMVVREVWIWIMMPIVQGFAAFAAVKLAFHFELMKPAVLEPRCASCGYLLEGLNSGRCPECGHEVDCAGAKE